MSCMIRRPVVIVGAGPTGITAATLLAQYGVRSLVLDRYADVYPQPRAVHLDDEVFRIVHRLGIAEEFAEDLPARARPAAAGPSDAGAGRVRPGSRPRPHGYPQANMFDQPEFEALLRTNLARHPLATLRGNVEVTDIAGIAAGRTRITYTDRADGSEHAVETDYVLGCDGANSLVRTRIGSTMRDLRFEQRWLVVDVATHSRPGPVGWRAPTVRSAPGRHLHADRRRALPLGVSVAARRERRRLRHTGRTRPTHRAVDGGNDVPMSSS